MEKEPGGFDYLDSVSKDSGSKPSLNSQMHVEQKGNVDMPADGGEGYVGGNSNASAFGMKYVTGKSGYSEDRPIIENTSFAPGDKDNTGTGDSQISAAGSDSTDEKASYKKVQMDEGLPQTYRNSAGAGDAGPAGSDEPDMDRVFGSDKRSPNDGNYATDLNTQSVPSSDAGDHDMDMPQTEFTSKGGSGAPYFKHRG